MFLPSELQSRLQFQDGVQVQLVLRTLSDVNGAVGEAYVVLASPLLTVASRRLGSDWQEIHYELTAVTDLVVHADSPDCRLAWTVPERAFDLPIPSYEQAAAEELRARWLQARQLAGQDLAQPAPAKRKAKKLPELTPVVAFSASLQAMLLVDGTASDEELRLVERLIERPAVVDQGAELLRALGQKELLAKLVGVLSEPQKQCLMANLYELAMVDGRLRASEVGLLDQFRAVLGMDRERCLELEQVLRTKNDLSVFSY